MGKPFEKKAATFADNGKVSSWALEGVGQVKAAGIMGGVGNNTFDPKDPYTREQSIITILRTYDAVKGGGTTEPTKGDIDKSLIGEWNYEDITSSEHHNYFFYENGTASLFITGNTNYHGEAKFSTLNGKIHLTEYYYINAIGEKTLRIDKVVEYSIGKDERGEYLTIGNIPGYTEYGENRPNMKFRKGTGTTEPPTSGSIDSKLIGKWQYQVGRSCYYNFKDDGTFTYFEFYEGNGTSTEGKYTTSNGKVYFTDIIYEKGETYEEHHADKVHEYKVSKTSDGDVCLIIGMILFTDSSQGTYVELDRAYEFTKAN